MNTNTNHQSFGTPALDFFYTTSGVQEIREAFDLAGFTSYVNSRGYIEAKLGEGSVSVAQDDNVLILRVRSEHNLLVGEMRLSGSLNSVAVLAAALAGVAK